MPRLNAANNAETTLTQNISSSATSFSVASSSLFPAAPFLVSIDDEILEVGAKTGNTFSSVIRGQEGTTPATHNSSTKVTNRFTAGMYKDLADGVNNLESAVGDITALLDAVNGEVV